MRFCHVLKVIATAALWKNYGYSQIPMTLQIAYFKGQRAESSHSVAIFATIMRQETNKNGHQRRRESRKKGVVYLSVDSSYERK